jgi:hypothetical protein
LLETLEEGAQAAAARDEALVADGVLPDALALLGGVGHGVCNSSIIGGLLGG